MIIPQQMVSKFSPLGNSIPKCNWMLDFLTNRPVSEGGKQHLQLNISLHRTSLPSIQDIAHKCFLSKARNIITDSTPPHHGLFSLPPSGKRFYNTTTRIARFCNSLILQNIRLMNTQ